MLNCLRMNQPSRPVSVDQGSARGGTLKMMLKHEAETSMPNADTSSESGRVPEEGATARWSAYSTP